MGLQENVKGGTKSYRKMNSDLIEEEDGVNLSNGDQEQEEERSSNTKKYVVACAIFASLNSVLLGYGW